MCVLQCISATGNSKISDLMVAKNITLVSLLGSAKAKLFNIFHWLKNFMYLAILNTYIFFINLEF